MGLYDREYYREERPAFSITAPKSAVAILIILNVAVWVVDSFTVTRDPLTGRVAHAWLSSVLAASGETLTRPWMWWQFLTYGFAHSPRDFTHILWNMVGLFFFGRLLEWHYGRNEFLRVYLVSIVVGGVSWALIDRLGGGHPNAIMYGASGAVAATVVLAALNFPHQTVLFMFVLPMPLWVLGALLVAMDMYGAVTRPGANVAYSVHLAGAAFAFLYFRMRWNLGRMIGGRFPFRLPRLTPRPKLRVHDPDRQGDAGPDAGDELGDEVDRILEKIHRQGEASLTRKERRTLEAASRQYQRKRHQQQS